MKKRLLITIILLTIFLTGCNVNYSLDIRDNVIKETLSITETNSDLYEEKDGTETSFYDYAKMYGEEIDLNTDYNGLYSQEECNDCSYYDKEFINENGLLGFELSHEFAFNEYAFSSIANEMIPAFSSTFDGRYLRINGGSSWNYFDTYDSLEDINISINTNYKVVSTNLEKESVGKYKWTIKNEDEKLYIVLDTKTVIEPEDNSDILIWLIIIVSGLIIALIFMSIHNRKK